MQQSPVTLLLADGWKEIEPVRIARQFIWSMDGDLETCQTDFSNPRILGRIGGLNCPIAVDNKRRVAYCTTSDDREIELAKPGENPFQLATCRIEEFDLLSGSSHVVSEPPEGYDFAWGPQLLPDRNRLISYVLAKDDSLERQLAFIDLTSGDLQVVPLTDEVSCPRSVDGERQRILFEGCHAVYLVNFQGEVAAFFPYDLQAYFCDGSFNKATGEVAFGVGGIYIWHEKQGNARKIHDSGDFPAWSPDGKYIWFSKDDSNLWRLDVATLKATRVIQLEGSVGNWRGYGCPVVPTSDGRYLLARLVKSVSATEQDATRRRRELIEANIELAQEGIYPGEGFYRFDYLFVFCVLDVENQQVWQSPGYTYNIAWVDG